MFMTCLDMEGVLTPEIWIAFADETGIPEFRLTTRDEPDYDKLMRYRIDLLKKHGLGLSQIQDTIARIKPLDGAKEFLDELRSFAQVCIVSDTFYEFAMPLVAQMNYPTILCNKLIVGDDGMITDYRMRVTQSKYSTVKAFQQMGFKTIAAGDSFNDVGMIKASSAGFLFRSTPEIKAANPGIPAIETYDELLAGIKQAMANE